MQTALYYTVYIQAIHSFTRRIRFLIYFVYIYMLLLLLLLPLLLVTVVVVVVVVASVGDTLGRWVFILCAALVLLVLSFLRMKPTLPRDE